MFTACATLVKVASRGCIRLSSTNPFWRPEIDAGYFEEPADLRAISAGCRALFDIAEQAPLAAFRGRPYLPASGRASTDEQLLQHIRALAQTLYHTVGTCAMGTGEQAVVDPDLRVRGIDGLRVVDASVMPAAPRGNTNAPTVMIAERAADLIRGIRPLSAANLTSLEPSR
jgi:choline dehydrogenase